jgi:hypothetical protein
MLYGILEGPKAPVVCLKIKRSERMTVMMQCGNDTCDLSTHALGCIATVQPAASTSLFQPRTRPKHPSPDPHFVDRIDGKAEQGTRKMSFHIDPTPFSNVARIKHAHNFRISEGFCNQSPVSELCGSRFGADFLPHVTSPEIRQKLR